MCAASGQGADHGRQSVAPVLQTHPTSALRSHLPGDSSILTPRRPTGPAAPNKPLICPQGRWPSRSSSRILTHGDGDCTSSRKAPPVDAADHIVSGLRCMTLEIHSPESWCAGSLVLRGAPVSRTPTRLPGYPTRRSHYPALDEDASERTVAGHRIVTGRDEDLDADVVS